MNRFLLFICFIFIIFYSIQIQDLNKAKQDLEFEKLEEQKRVYTLQEENNDLRKEIKNLNILIWSIKHSSPKVKHETLLNVVEETRKYKKSLLILSIMKEESNFYPYAISNKGAKGISQIMPLWIEELKEKKIVKYEDHLFSWKKNIAACDYILDKYHKRFNDWNLVLYNYVGGDWDYVRRVNKNLQQLQTIEGGVYEG